MSKFQFTVIVLLLVSLSSGAVAQTGTELILPTELHGTVKLYAATISSWDTKLGYNYLSVYVKNEREDYTSNPVQGQYEIEGNYLLFKPHFPFESGMTYLVRTINSAFDSTYFYQPFQVGKKKKIEQAEVISIYPSADRLPENLLRFYIYFNTPMKKGRALKHIKLIDEDGNNDLHAFMEFKQELWSADGKRLTLLFDPGRIKRGVSTNLVKGPALLKGQQYKLVISDNWQDVYGQALSASSTKEIEVVNAYRDHIRPSDWVLDIPKANHSDLLSLHFGRIIDHALIQSMIKIVDSKEKLVTGYWEIIEKEGSVNFIPEIKWKPGSYRVVIDSRLEDVAGNNLHNLLDYTATDRERNSQPFRWIDFRI